MDKLLFIDARGFIESVANLLRYRVAVVNDAEVANVAAAAVISLVVLVNDVAVAVVNVVTSAVVNDAAVANVAAVAFAAAVALIYVSAVAANQCCCS